MAKFAYCYYKSMFKYLWEVVYIRDSSAWIERCWPMKSVDAYIWPKLRYLMRYRRHNIVKCHGSLAGKGNATLLLLEIWRLHEEQRKLRRSKVISIIWKSLNGLEVFRTVRRKMFDWVNRVGCGSYVNVSRISECSCGNLIPWECLVN